MAEKTTKGLGQGIHTVPRSTEDIPPQSASDSSGWLSTDGQIELMRGRTLVGAELTDNGSVQGHGYGYKADGTTVHFRKINTKIQYYNTTTGLWVDIITGLTSGAEYTFSPYSSLAGTFIYATGLDGLYKIHTANPASYIDLYDSTKNFKGKSIISSVNGIRMYMYDTIESKTTLYLSYIDGQDDNVYTDTLKETIGTGDGANKTFTGTLAYKSTDSLSNVFTIEIFGQIQAQKTITGITKSQKTTITSAGHGYVAGEYILFEGVVGMTEINGLVGKILTTATDSFTVAINSENFTAYTSGGTAKKVEYFTDNKNGLITSNLGGTGTINYMTGAWSAIFNTAPTNTASNIFASYSHENSNNKGITDFRFSSTRLAGEGDLINQSEGGDAIQKVTVHDGSVYSLKQRSVYQLTLGSTDVTATNKVFRKDIGMQYWRSSVTTGKGIIFMDTANREKPQLTILTPNALGDNLEPVVLAKQFDFSNYEWDMCAMGTFGEFIVFSGRTPSNSTNDTLFFYNFRRGTIDILPYFAKTILEIEGRLYIGDTTTENVYEILTGFDDDDQAISNYWISGDDLFGTTRLKKVKRFRIKGLITPSQKLEVYVNYDDSDYTQIGTILGNGSYVSSDSNPYTIGANGIGTSIIGGESSGEDGNIYFTEFHLSQGKFRKRRIKLVATGVGYVSVNMYQDFKVMLFEDRLPKANRQKQNVSLDGTLTNQ